MQYVIPADKQIFKIGRSATCDIILDESIISREQVAIVKLGGMCYFMDCGSHDCVSFN
ncbi:MAG: FHA domain-containing protein [Lentisphaerales bacterium]|nr:FHA domain-containing protein [Lentisphaerales bacterium]